jgi:hypothetical protein|tara:strand:- start:282 stop:611 length:330 start_codon:yes stop_codon:yes gene_type:complete
MTEYYELGRIEECLPTACTNETKEMNLQSSIALAKAKNATLKTKTQFTDSNPAITRGGLDWLIFNKREDLLLAQAIAYFGSKVLVHEDNLNRYILEGGARKIGGLQNIA